MKKFLILAAFVAASSFSFAQAPTSISQTAPTAQQKSPDQQADRRAQYLAKELGLTADQQTKLQPILLAQHQNMLSMRDKRQAGGDRQGMGQEMKATQAKYDEQIKAVLTPEQYTKFDQMKDERRDKMREQRGNR